MGNMDTGIVICSRSDSQRVPNKPFVQINGAPVLEHLIKRLIPTGIHIYLAVPHDDFSIYRKFAERFSKKDLTVVAGSAQDPLLRMYTVALKHDLDAVVRVCHDKIFMHPETILHAVETFWNSKLDYLYSSAFVDGSGFEVISYESMRKATQLFHNIEHVGYAIHCVTKNTANMADNHMQPKTSHRLLIDYPEDLKVMELIFSEIGNDATLEDAIAFLDENPWVAKINQLPKLTVYTCAYNAERWIKTAMGSVSSQHGFGEMQYILIDDHSEDKTSFHMSQFCSVYKNAEWIRNQKNIGLASSSNIALSKAKGKYIVRLDADDYFCAHNALEKLTAYIEATGADIVYPDNYHGSFKRIQKGMEQHHVGGAIFRTRAANHVKFTDGLRGYEGYDFFSRAKEVLKLGYYEKPVFFYRQHAGSLSRLDEAGRKRIKEQIDEDLAQRHRDHVSAVR